MRGRPAPGAGVRLSYAPRGPNDNPEMESFFGRFTVENRSLISEGYRSGASADGTRDSGDAPTVKLSW